MRICVEIFIRLRLRAKATATAEADIGRAVYTFFMNTNWDVRSSEIT